MKPRQASTDPLDRSRFPVDPWRLVECDPDRSDLGVTETLFTVANGYIGMRGNPEEGRHAFEHGTYVNGLHETWPIRHAEAAYGFARTGQTIVNAPDAKLMKLYVDDEPLVIGTADLEHYERALDFRDGVLRRSLIWRTPSGKRVKVDSTRMVSMTQRHLVVLTLEVTMLSGDAPLVVSSQLLNRQDGVDEYHLQAADQRGPRRPAQGRRVRGAGAAAAHPHGQGRPDDARLPVRELADDGRRRRRPRAAHAGPLRGRHGRRAGPHQDGLPRRRRGGPHPADREGRGVPHLARAPRARAVRPLPAHPRPGRPLRPRPLAGRAARLVRRLLGGQRRRGRRRTSPTTRPSSRPSGSTSSRWRRPAAGPTVTGSRPRGSPARATKGTTSGTARSTSRRSSATRAPSSPAT